MSGGAYDSRSTLRAIVALLQCACDHAQRQSEHGALEIRARTRGVLRAVARPGSRLNTPMSDELRSRPLSHAAWTPLWKWGVRSKSRHSESSLLRIAKAHFLKNDEMRCDGLCLPRT